MPTRLSQCNILPKRCRLMDYTLLGDPNVESVIFICMKNTYLSDHAFESISFFIALQS
jgi:hypothetical protein